MDLPKIKSIVSHRVDVNNSVNYNTLTKKTIKRKSYFSHNICSLAYLMSGKYNTLEHN
jgi:hypothetical protein